LGKQENHKSRLIEGIQGERDIANFTDLRKWSKFKTINSTAKVSIETVQIKKFNLKSGLKKQY